MSGAIIVLLVVAVLVLTAGLGVANAAPRTLDRPDGFFAFAQAIATAEGYGVPDAIPTVRNNPGDLRWTGADITTFDTPEAGWNALYRQLDLIRTGATGLYSVDMSIGAMAQVYTATEASAWAANVAGALVAQGFPATVDSPLREFLL